MNYLFNQLLLVSAGLLDKDSDNGTSWYDTKFWFWEST